MLILSAALLTGCAETAPAIDPAVPSAVEQLYRIRIDGRMTGAPNEAELAQMAPYLSAELQTLLRAAAKLRDDEARAHPDEKPPFVEGDLFTSLFEGPTAAKVSRGQLDGGVYKLSVEFSDDRAEPDAFWTDRVILKQEGGKWVVSDVEYAGLWDFANKGSLVASLKAGLQ